MVNVGMPNGELNVNYYLACSVTKGVENLP